MDSSPSHAFQPLSDEEIATAEASKPSTRPDYWPLAPVPDDAPPIGEYGHRDFGKPSMVWPYRNAQGQVIGYAARFDVANDDGTTDKEVLPISFCTNDKAQRFWAAKGFDDPRPPYRLPELSAKPGAPVLLVEGEKTVDAAVALFPDMAVTTSPGGGKAVHKTDWSSLNGRHVTIWRDNDEPGEAYAQKAGQAILDSGALSVSVVDVPDVFPEGWDLADAPPDGADLASMLANAAPFEEMPKFVSFGRYLMTEHGLYFSKEDGDSVWLSAPFEVVAETRSSESENWGLLVRWKDADRRSHERAMPHELLAGSGDEIRRILLRQGLRMAHNQSARNMFLGYLSSVKCASRARSVESTGWHGDTFVLPGRSIGDTPADRVLLQTVGHVDHAYREGGNLAEWQEHVAALAAGNSRLELGICLALTGPLLRLIGEESGGVHLRGASSTGKSTALEVAASVWGGGPNGYVRSWRATDNGLEIVAAMHSETFLALDEISQIDPRHAGQAAYMLGNGVGKSRMTKGGESRPPQRWRVPFMSTGEMSLEDKMSEDGKPRRMAAGQAVRVIDLPADAGKGKGLFEVTPSDITPERFSRLMKESASRFYGTAGPALVAAIIPRKVAIAGRLKGFQEEFIEEHRPADAGGQITRVLGRFAIIAAAGELATALGILPWEKGTAKEAAATCFAAWMEARGSTDEGEVLAMISQVQQHFERFGGTRYQPWDPNDDNYEGESGAAGRHPTAERYGFRKKVDGEIHYFVLPESWRKEVCKGLDMTQVNKVLVARGMLKPGGDNRASSSIHLPAGMGKRRCYVMTARIHDGLEEQVEQRQGVHF